MNDPVTIENLDKILGLYDRHGVCCICGTYLANTGYNADIITADKNKRCCKDCNDTIMLNVPYLLVFDGTTPEECRRSLCKKQSRTYKNLQIMQEHIAKKRDDRELLKTQEYDVQVESDEQSVTYDLNDRIQKQFEPQKLGRSIRDENRCFVEMYEIDWENEKHNMCASVAVNIYEINPKYSFDPWMIDDTQERHVMNTFVKKVLYNFDFPNEGAIKVAYIDHIYVHESYRGVGIGRFLFNNLPGILKHQAKIEPAFFVLACKPFNLQSLIFPDKLAYISMSAEDLRLYENLNIRDTEVKANTQAVLQKLSEEAGYRKISESYGGIYIKQSFKGVGFAEGFFELTLRQSESTGKPQIQSIEKRAQTPTNLGPDEFPLYYMAHIGINLLDTETGADTRVGILNLAQYNYDAVYVTDSSPNVTLNPNGWNMEADAECAINHMLSIEKGDPEYEKNPHGKTGYIATMYIAEDYRNRGIAQMIHKKIFEIYEATIGGRPDLIFTVASPEDWNRAYKDFYGKPQAMGHDAAEGIRQIQFHVLEKAGFKPIDMSRWDKGRYFSMALSDIRFIQDKKKSRTPKAEGIKK